MGREIILYLLCACCFGGVGGLGWGLRIDDVMEVEVWWRRDMGPESGLTVVGPGADEVDWEEMGEAAREVEELIEVALGREWDYHHHHILVFLEFC